MWLRPTSPCVPTEPSVAPRAALHLVSMRAFLLSATLCSSPVWSQQQTAPAQAKPDELAALQQGKLKSAVAARHGILYDTGFDLHSKRQFCSRYVREVVEEAADVQLGQVEHFATLLK